jgi:hypothetical protein
MALMSDDRLYEPYTFEFEEGDLVQLKEGEDLREVHAELTSMVEEEGIPVDWCPPLEVLEDLSDAIFRVTMLNAFHGGVPLLILRFQRDGESQEIRLFQGLVEPLDEA